MSKLVSFIKVVVILSAGVLFYVFFKNDVAALHAKYFPCSWPISYEIGYFDERFGVSRDEFKSYLVQAELIWEEPVSKNLFVYKKGGRLKVNLIYDDRQEATNILGELSLVVGESRESYEKLRDEYDRLKAQFERDNSNYEKERVALDARLSAYNAEVAKWNRQGGAPRAVYENLESEKVAINNEVKRLNEFSRKLSQDAGRLNSLVPSLNRLATKYNIDAGKYNEIGENYREFDGGTYTVGKDGLAINIYQFDDSTALLRVLAHEFGHALGLDHISDSEAIMYYLNRDQGISLTASDIEALKIHCRIN